MKELSEYRTGLIDRLEQAANEFCEACLRANDVFAPLRGSSWNVHQIAVHLRDVDKLVYGMRARRTATEDNPEFQSFDGESYMAEHYSADEHLDQILNELRNSVIELTSMLRKLPVEAWARLSRHVTLGHGLTLQSWVERALAHIEEHLESVNENR